MSGRRTQIVATLRVALPLAALAILSTLFLLSRAPDPDAAIPYAKVDANALAREPRITAPRYATVTPDGASVRVSADAASPDPAAGGVVRGVTLDWDDGRGTAARLTAPTAAVEGQAVRLDGGVQLDVSGGYRLQAAQMQVSTDAARISAGAGAVAPAGTPAAVTATAPMGTITAGRMVLDQSDGAGASVLDFAGGVRLIYQP